MSTDSWPSLKGWLTCRLRCLWAKERNWPLTLLMSVLLVTCTIVGGFLMMIIIGVSSLRDLGHVQPHQSHDAGLVFGLSPMEACTFHGSMCAQHPWKCFVLCLSHPRQRKRASECMLLQAWPIDLLVLPHRIKMQNGGRDRIAPLYCRA